MNSTSGKSPLIHDIERNYGSTQSTSICQDDGPIVIDGRSSITAGNVGMLFIISSQFFFASMDISVKMLNSLDPPVHALEVSSFIIFYPRMESLQFNRLL